MRFPLKDTRIAGVVVPVGALRTAASTGVGDYADLPEFADLCARIGVSLIQLLPVNDSGFQSSPYSALTAFGLHPLYLRLADVEGSAAFADRIAALSAAHDGADRFRYAEVLAAKLEILRAVYDASAGRIAAEAASGPLAAWIAENPWVKEYAVYLKLKADNGGKHWKEWADLRRPSPAAIEARWKDPVLRGEHLFWAWLQREADRQFSAASAAVAARGIALKGDLPILMNEDSCDVWAHPEFFRSELSAGAPPDMFSPLGQNWRFPIYDWDALAKDGYRWWKDRLKAADRYYAAYRIDHVLGFFRIWAASRRDASAVLGRFVPSEWISRAELAGLGFDDGRVRWLSRPHVPTGAVYEALVGAGLSADQAVEEAGKVFSAALDRIGSEELWLFKESIHGELDIEELGLHRAAAGYLQSAWRDRALLEFEPGKFAPTWSYWATTSFPTLSDDERRRFDELVSRKRSASEADWEKQGRRLLSALLEATPMLACAEDLGAVPDCVPRVLADLGVLGLRVQRWARRWGESGEPFVPLASYPEATVCTPAVHDSSTVRAWWEQEADRDAFRAFAGDRAIPDPYGPETARAVLGAVARAASRICVFQVQDLLHLSPSWYASDAASERVNVPGTVNEFNWTYRLPASVAEIGADAAFVDGASAIAAARKETR